LITETEIALLLSCS